MYGPSIPPWPRARILHPTAVRIVVLGLGLLAASTDGAALAQPAGEDLSGYVVSPHAIGDGWSITNQRAEPTLFRDGFDPQAISGYVVNYAQGPQMTASVALYEFPDHAGAVASSSDFTYYWGHGEISVLPLSGPGDDPKFRVYPIGAGPSSGMTIVDGRIVAYLRAGDDGAADVTGVDATCDSLAAAVLEILHANDHSVR